MRVFSVKMVTELELQAFLKLKMDNRTYSKSIAFTLQRKSDSLHHYLKINTMPQVKKERKKVKLIQIML